MAACNKVKISFDRSDETIRCSLVPHLSAAFGRKGITVLTDKHDEFCKCIASVFIFSKNYVSIKESLDDFVKTSQRRNDKGHVVANVFFGVSRSVLKEKFAMAAFERFTSYHASQWCHEKTNNQSDCEFVEKIATDVYEKIFPKERIGIYSRMLQDISNLLCSQPWGAKSIGFWGMPGIGKTELAKAVFDQMSSDYEVTCFIQNFHETFETKGLYSLLQEHCKNLTKQNLPKRVLLVLDDVRNHLYAESLRAELPSFSLGSVIIITSRDEQVLSHCQVNQTYKVEGLNKNEAMQLFSRCAFGKDVKETNLLKDISMKVIEYADGNPLALRVYGKEMSSQEQPSQKETLFLKLKQDPPHQIMEVVKSSYYALSDNEKNILVYIAFCFTGKHIEDVSKLLKDLGFFPEIGIDQLVANSLVTISENRLEMHNMIQAVVKKIGGCSEDTNTSFKCVLGTKDIEAISMDASNINLDVKLSSLGSMYNLRYLNISYSDPGKHGKALESLSLPYGIKFLNWENYPLKYLPQDFDLSNLVELNMPYSQLQTLWGGTQKQFKMLKRINLRHSQKLLEVDELSEARNLEEVDLCGCKNLQRFPSISNLHKLRVVDLPSCTKIKSFPEFPSNVELKFEGSPIKTMSPLLILENPTKPSNYKPHGPHILDILRPGSFFNSQKRITNPGMGESSPTFTDIVCEKAILMSQWSLEKLNSFRKVDF
ncbi:unnamed protein product [Eruca vesicaria subsp. sativa]|uniref:Uncharacterized protein n=1 Tax=Eruca vesicaria subsp. sativa TaxID=29727 RepID=A0ABC8L544_ERUVS|nr:unnamed protein product [Eruca vesicaria subsp. sativa]